MILKRDDAVSPVIGILLMLVVTIIIAAVVSGFAGSLSSDQSKAPQVSLAVSPIIQNITDTDTSDSDPGYPSEEYEAKNGLMFEHKGGDTFTLSDIKIQIQTVDTKITITNGDKMPTDENCTPSLSSYLVKIGGSDTTIKPGDKFMLYADNCEIGRLGKGISWGPEGSNGAKTCYLNKKNEYKVIDIASDKVMQQGSFVLQ